jgi:polyhydroxyalkanoate synthesis regulator phasin
MINFSLNKKTNMTPNEENNEQLTEQTTTPNNEVVVEIVEDTKEQAQTEEEPAANDSKNEKETIEELLKRLADAGMSLLGVAKNKAEKAVNSFVEKSKIKISTENRKELVDEIFEETEKARENIETRLREVGEKIKTRFDFATRKDVKKLKKRVKKLEKLLKGESTTTESNNNEASAEEQ